MTGKTSALSSGCAAFALILLGCGSITPLDGDDGGVPPPPNATSPDAGIVSVLTHDAGRPDPGGAKDPGLSPPASKDAATPPMTNDGGPRPNAGTGGAPGQGGSGGTAQGCANKGDCSDGLVCNVATGVCVECLADGDCREKTKLCDLTTLTCLQCDGDCGGN